MAGVAVRDSTDPDGPHLLLSSAAWAAFVDRLSAHAAERHYFHQVPEEYVQSLTVELS
jgi:hypothetical protein